ncbi:MAG: alpha/beta fold hydrolase [Candidatus Diapherotrites archaeon]|nr:alpha/beta fold hydrolase [Candidatus Diapherotrites archaeon]
MKNPLKHSRRKKPAPKTDRVTILNRRGKRLHGFLTNVGSTSIVLVLPGAGESCNQIFYQKIAKVAAAHGLDCLRMDLSGYGESEGNRFEITPTLHVQDVVDIYTQLKPNYSSFYAAGFSWGAYIALITSLHVPFHLQFIFSPAIFYENREINHAFNRAWKRNGWLPDYNVFVKNGSIRPQKEKHQLNYAFLTSLRRYTIDNVSRTRVPTILGCGKKEKLFVKQINQLKEKIHAPVQKNLFSGVGHESRNPLYYEKALKLINDNLPTI